MPSAPLGQCLGCHISEDDLGTRLLTCAGCKLGYYCSKDCQKKDWPVHKVLCKLQQEGKKEILKKSVNRESFNGLPAREILKRFMKWHEVMQPEIGLYLEAALDLQSDNDRCFTHMVWLNVKVNITAQTPKSKKEADIKRYFEMDTRAVREINEVLPKLRDPSAKNAIVAALERSKSLRNSGEAFGTLILLVYLPEVKLQQMINLTIERPSILPADPDWTGHLKYLIDRGRNVDKY